MELFHTASIRYIYCTCAEIDEDVPVHVRAPFPWDGVWMGVRLKLQVLYFPIKCDHIIICLADNDCGGKCSYSPN